MDAVTPMTRSRCGFSKRSGTMVPTGNFRKSQGRGCQTPASADWHMLADRDFPFLPPVSRLGLP